VSIQSEPAAFEGLYLRTIGVLYGELDDLNAQIAELIPQQQETHEATQNAPGATERARATADLKSLYRDVAKKVYPDLTSDPADRAGREKLMADANRAYGCGDADALRRIFEDSGSSPEGEQGNGVAADLFHVIRKITQVRNRLADIEESVLLKSGSAELMAKSEEYKKKGRDLLAELAENLSAQIKASRQRMDSLSDFRLDKGQEDDECTDSRETVSSPSGALAKRSQSLAQRGIRDIEAAEAPEVMEAVIRRREPDHTLLHHCTWVGKAMGRKSGTNPAERILVVDDQHEIREVICAMLTQSGYNCTAVAGGHDALALLKSGEEFDLLITDILNLPMDGFTLLQRSKEGYPDIPVVIASLIHDVSLAAACIRNGAHDYLFEPFEREELLTVVRRALEHRSLQLWNREMEAKKTRKITG
jgi:CheY-like chemotaxis protein